MICDHRLNDPAAAEARLALLFGFAAFRPGEFQSFLVVHTPQRSRVRAVSLNHLANMSAREAELIETAILRQLVIEPANGAAGGRV